MLMSTSTESQKVIKQGKKWELQGRNKRIDLDMLIKINYTYSLDQIDFYYHKPHI